MLYLIHKYLTQAAAGTQARLRAGAVEASTVTGGAGGSSSGVGTPEARAGCGGAGAAAASGATQRASEPAEEAAAAAAASKAKDGCELDSDVRDVQVNLGRIRCALPLPTGENAVAHPDWSEGQPPLHPHAAAAFQAALLSNANLCGDNCNRGMLAGAVLGFLFGAHNIPAPLVAGLHRYDAELRHTIRAFVERIVRPQVDAMSGAAADAATHTSSVIASRFGRPALLPVLRFPLYAAPATASGADSALAEARPAGGAAAGDGAQAGVLVHAPRDLSHKLRMLQLCTERTQAVAAAGSVFLKHSAAGASAGTDGSTLAQLSIAGKPLLRFHKGSGPLLVEPAPPLSSVLSAAAAAAGRVARPLLLPQAAAVPHGAGAAASSSAAPPAGDLDDGDAAADRAAALAAMQAGNASGVLSASTASGTSGVMPPPLPTPLAHRSPSQAALAVTASGADAAAASSPDAGGGAAAVSSAQVAAPAAPSGVVRVAEMHSSALDSELPCKALLDASALTTSRISSAAVAASALTPSHISSAAVAVAAVQDVIGVAAEPGTGILYYRPRDAAAAAALLAASGAESEPWAAIVARHRSIGSAAGGAGGLTEAASGTCK